MLFEAEVQLLQLIMEDEVSWLTGARYDRSDDRNMQRWGKAAGSVVLHGQKIPVRRPRIRGRDGGDMKLGSYELFRGDEQMQRQVWSRVMRGLTMRGYDPAIRERDRAFGLSKSSISDRFILASTEQVNTLLKRDISKVNLCVLMVDGVEYCRNTSSSRSASIRPERRAFWASTRAPRRTSKSAINCSTVWPIVD